MARPTKMTERFNVYLPCRLSRPAVLLTSKQQGISLALLMCLVAIYNTSLFQIVGRQLYLHPVPKQDPDVESSHPARQVSQYALAGIQLDAKHGVRQRLHNSTCHFEPLSFLCIGQWILTSC